MTRDQNPATLVAWLRELAAVGRDAPGDDAASESAVLRARADEAWAAIEAWVREYVPAGLRRDFGRKAWEEPIDVVCDHVIDMAVEKAGQFQGDSEREAEAWLRSIARNRMLSILRSGTRIDPDGAEKAAQVVDPRPGPVERAEAGEDLQRLRRVVARLRLALGSRRTNAHRFLETRLTSRTIAEQLAEFPTPAALYAARYRGRKQLAAIAAALDPPLDLVESAMVERLLGTALEDEDSSGEDAGQRPHRGGDDD